MSKSDFLRRYWEIMAQKPGLLDVEIAKLMNMTKGAFKQRKYRYGLTNKVGEKNKIRKI